MSVNVKHISRYILPGCLFVFLFVEPLYGVTKPVELSSPDGNITLTVMFEKNYPRYSVQHRDRTVVKPSRAGMLFQQEVDHWTVVGHRTESVDNTWETKVGKRTPVRNRFRELRVTLGQEADPDDPRRLRVIFRVYNHGIGFRYHILPPQNKKDKVTVKYDVSQFRLPSESTGWCHNREHRPKGPIQLGSSDTGLQLPVLVDTGTGTWVAIAEAALYDFPPFTPNLKKREARIAPRVGEFTVHAPFKTPWRVVMVGDEPGELKDSDLMFNLNPPREEGKFDWVKPGVSTEDWRARGYKADDGFKYRTGLETWKRFIDFAAETRLQYVQNGVNWYEHKPWYDQIPADVENPLKKPFKQVRRSIQYANKKGIKNRVYIDDEAVETFGVETIFESFSRWGVDAVKYGFMDGSRLHKVRLTQHVIEECAENELLVTFHDHPAPPSGKIRTWPNASSREYCHSQADGHRSFTPSTFILQAYVNNLMGPIDMINGYFALEGISSRPNVWEGIPSTIIAETARTLIIYSGGMTVIPYAADAYREHLELFEFIAAQKPPWKESRTLQGEMGKYITTMRRTGKTYLVASATNEEERTVEIDLVFLGNGTYDATIYRDAADAHYKKNKEDYSINHRTVTSKDTIKAPLAPGGGHCIMLEPVEEGK